MSKISLKPSATGTGTYTIEAPAGNLSKTLTLPDEDGTLTTVEQVLANKITLGTAKSATGTYVDFIGIPSWAKRVTVMFDGVSTNGTSHVVVQLGSGAIETSGYVCGAGAVVGTAVGSSTYTTGFGTYAANAADFRHGSMNISKISGNKWVAEGTINANGANNTISIAGSKSLTNTLDRIRITTVNGTDQFDAGTINISWE